MITINRKDIDFSSVQAISSCNEKIILFRKSGDEEILWNNIEDQIDELDAIYLELANEGVITLGDGTFKKKDLVAFLDTSTQGSAPSGAAYLSGRATAVKVLWGDDDTCASDLQELWDNVSNETYLSGLLVCNDSLINGIDLFHREISIDIHKISIAYSARNGSREDYDDACAKVVSELALRKPKVGFPKKKLSL